MNKAKVYAVGIGPGDEKYLTAQARAALDESELIFGYTVYAELLRPLYTEKKYRCTAMTQELSRCRMALEAAAEGRVCAVICSGDAGVYGMASPLLELSGEFPDVEVEVVPGITAALSGGAILGAPLAHDFCVISMSDRLIDMEVIRKRLRAAAQGDFAIAIYNPSSKGRPEHLRHAAELLMQSGKAPDTVCGIVRQIGREGESMEILSLLELSKAETDMFTTVFIGNADTVKSGNRMLTPRGYRGK